MESNKETKTYDEDLSLFPDLQQYKRQLQQLRELTPDNTPFDKLYDKYFDLAVILPQITAMQTAENFNQHRFFRVRLNINEDTEDTRIIQTHSYPPGYVCKENGRANLKGRSVFYCSNDPTCALLESKPKVGDIAHISIWRGAATRDIKIALCLPFNLTDFNSFQVMANEAWAFAKKHYTDEARDKFEHFIELNKFIADRFVQERIPYFLTSWFADQILFHNDHWRDYILYPSVESNKKYCNMAFHPNTVTRFMTLEKVIRVKIVKVENKDVEFTMGRVGEIEKTNLKWRKATDIEDKLFTDYGFVPNEIKK
ncbi:RES domain-containing protein [Algoriphagus pacificus]|uniref:RES domain-containing protein n=1 Tax=Algoriphagus pacificus TaxID=2811234 RepID=A0ABS3CDP6_9BACT|nr:RES domain-containing protein [Algoriphagus pacificus]MBN7815132.1 RES domain-containing protein [Algoriphagus pacificus]